MPSSSPDGPRTASQPRNEVEIQDMPPGARRTPGTAYRKGQTRAVELYLDREAREILLSDRHGLDRSTTLLLAIEYAANAVARDKPKIEFSGIFTGSARHPNGRRNGLDDPKRLHISMKTEHAKILGDLVASTRLSMSGFVEECLIRWGRNGLPLAGEVGRATHQETGPKQAW